MSGASPPTASVIIPVRNGAELLDRCLAALDHQDYGGTIEVLVVDNGSTEDLAAVTDRHPGVRLLQEQRPGSYAARNLALTVATGEVLAFTDGDCEPSPGWLREAVTALVEEPVADMVGGRVNVTYAHGDPRSASELFEAVHGFPQERYLEDQQFAVTANMITWRRVVDRVGPFDAALASRGDANWGQRVAESGGLQRFARDAVVFHPARATWPESLEKWRRVARGRVVNDLRAGRRSWHHFAGLAFGQVRDLIRALPQVRHESRLAGPTQQVRYMSALIVCRLLTAVTYLQGLIPWTLGQTSHRRATNPYSG